jgi:hypothetical protein
MRPPEEELPMRPPEEEPPMRLPEDDDDPVLAPFGGVMLFPLPGVWAGDDGCTPLGGGWPTLPDCWPLVPDCWPAPPDGAPPDGAAAIRAADPTAKPAIAMLENAIFLKNMVFLSGIRRPSI